MFLHLSVLSYRSIQAWFCFGAGMTQRAPFPCTPWPFYWCLLGKKLQPDPGSARWTRAPHGWELPGTLDGQWELKVTLKHLGHHMAGIKEGTGKNMAAVPTEPWTSIRRSLCTRNSKITSKHPSMDCPIFPHFQPHVLEIGCQSFPKCPAAPWHFWSYPVGSNLWRSCS